MRYFIHIATGSTVITDLEGAEFPDLASAEAEAAQSARELMADELRCGKPAPLRWRAQIASEDGTILKSIGFAALIAGDDAPLPWLPPEGDGESPPETSTQRPPSAGFAALCERARATMERSRRLNEEIRTVVDDIRNGVRELNNFREERR